MINSRIPLSEPNIDSGDLQAVLKTLKLGWVSSKSASVEHFETLFAKYVSQTKYAVAVNSGTSALFLALRVLNIGPGDEVILPSFTMIATINAVLWVGATPVLVDSSSKEDWNINIREIEAKINSRTKAILPVHIYGYSCNMKAILALAKKHGLSVIEDAAEAMGSTYQKRALGSFGDLSCFSLYANKIITTGNGGIIATNNLHLYEMIKRLSFFDFNKLTHFKHRLVGYNLTLSGLQAALGVSQVKKFSKLLRKRLQIFQWYKRYLNLNQTLTFIAPLTETEPNYWFPAVIFKGRQVKANVVRLLTTKKIETRDFFLPLHQQPVFKRKFLNEQYPMAEYFSQHGLLLPSFFKLSCEQVKTVCDLINQVTA